MLKKEEIEEKLSAISGVRILHWASDGPIVLCDSDGLDKLEKLHLPCLAYETISADFVASHRIGLRPFSLPEPMTVSIRELNNWLKINHESEINEEMLKTLGLRG